MVRAKRAVLAPMAGVTNRPFRELCRSFGPGLFISEMITARALVEGSGATPRMIGFGPEEQPRSLQLHGTDPATVAAAVALVAQRDLADHVDLNFGCPVPKVTRKGGGAALPWKLGRFRELVGRSVEAADGRVPVTVKLRLGIDAGHLTYVEAALAAEAVGAAAVTLHARTAAQLYSGQADWEAIGHLKSLVKTIPVLGNGDIFSGDDAVAMMARTGCDGVVVGRGCQGRPWLFADMAAALAGSAERLRPSLGFVCQVVRRHAQALVEYRGDEGAGVRELRGHMSWYLRGYPVGSEARVAAHAIGSLADLERLFGLLDLDAPYPGEAAEGPRGRRGSERTPVLPEGWLASRT
ncbi:MAG: tRNA dihydrouridine synthase DusB [Bifidobacteriaceae bacterium]|jgi:nifR3 family TIM-barrel protein|nr:tRNA dihydrouridine synthase DusB [Bifidobacteriaceae bacterium]